MYSIILPFKYAGDRWPLFEAVVENLYELIKDNLNFELCIHESSSERFLSDEWLDRFKIRYLYSKWDETFHRSWNLNVAARYLASGDTFIFFDGDIIVGPDFIKEVQNSNALTCWGWNTIHYLTKEATEKYIKTKEIINDFKNSRTPELWNCAGGINIIKRKVFFDTAGWPEEFRGVYGGPDNLFTMKLIKLNLINNPLNVIAYHLNHEHKTQPEFESIEHIQQKEKRMEILNYFNNFSISNWNKYIFNTQGFGDISLAPKIEFRGI